MHIAQLFQKRNKRLGVRPVRGDIRLHRTIVSARFGGSFSPIPQFEKFEIHTVFLRFSNFDSTKNLSPNLLAKLYGVAIRRFLQK